MNTSPPVKFLSLGDNCTTARQLKRLGLRTAAYPFDQTFSPHRTLIKMLRTDFAAVLSGEVIVTCMTTEFQWAHQPSGELSPALFDRLQRRIQRLRDLRHAGPVCFIRYIGPHSAERQRNHLADHAELSNALQQFGFQDFRLIYAVHGLTINHPHLFPMPGQLPTREPWLGNNTDWDHLITHLQSP